MFSKDAWLDKPHLNMGADLLGPRKDDQLPASKMEWLAGRVSAALLISGKTFTSMNTSKQGVQEIYKIQRLLGLLPELQEKPKKSNEEAQTLRAKGNRVYANDPIEALRLYTRAVCCSEWAGEEMAIAHANRSAVTYRLKEYRNSIEDATRAMSTGNYPKHLTPKLLERRGKCFLALHQYSKASEDFKQAMVLILNTQIDSEKVDVLKTCTNLLEGCLGNQDAPIEPTMNTPKLTHGPSLQIESASAALNVAFSPEMGRHIVATTDISPGDVLAIETPFASTLFRDRWEFFCHHCKKRWHSLIPCKSCNDVAFCSELCRESNWTAYHSLECKVLHDLNSLGCNIAIMMAVQTLFKTTKLGENLQMFVKDYLKEGSDDESNTPGKRGFEHNFYKSDFKGIHHLTDNKEHRSEPELTVVAVYASTLVHILKETTTLFEHSDAGFSDAIARPEGDLQWNHIVAADLLMRYMMISSGNAYQSHEVRWKREGDEMEFDPQVIGNAIYPFLSLLNHSCSSDTQLCHYNGNSLVLIALKPIDKGQQVFGNYGYVYHIDDRSKRQQELSRKFHFTCKCIACLEDWPTFCNLPDENPTFVSARAKKCFDREVGPFLGNLPEVFMNLNNGKPTEKDLKVLIQVITMTRKYVKEPWKVYLVSQIAIRHHFLLTFNPVRKHEFSPVHKGSLTIQVERETCDRDKSSVLNTF